MDTSLLRQLLAELTAVLESVPPPPPPPVDPPVDPPVVPVDPPVVPAPGGPPPAGLLDVTTAFTYLGACRTSPPETDTAPSFGFSQGPLAFTPTGTLFIGKPNLEGNPTAMLAEIALPTTLVVPPPTGDVSMLPLTTIVQPLTDPCEGQANLFGDDGVLPNVLGGLTVLPDGTLHGAGYLFYDANGTVTKSHYRRAADLKAKSFSGWFAVGPPSRQGFVGQGIVAIPAGWQARLGGTHLATGGALAIISRTSAGPSATVFDATQGDGQHDVPGTLLLGYDMDHQTLGTYEGVTGTASPAYNMATALGGAFIVGDSLIFVGVTGLGKAAYGSGTSDKALDGTLTGEGTDTWVYDPISGDKGGHAYPYVHYLWAYNLHDLAAVKAGTKTYWEVVPYQMAELKIPTPLAVTASSMAYDAATKRLVVLQPTTDPSDSGYYAGPVLHVYQVA